MYLALRDEAYYSTYAKTASLISVFAHSVGESFSSFARRLSCCAVDPNGGMKEEAASVCHETKVVEPCSLLCDRGHGKVSSATKMRPGCSALPHPITRVFVAALRREVLLSLENLDKQLTGSCSLKTLERMACFSCKPRTDPLLVG